MSFYKAIITVGGLTLGSRIMGFIRDILTAAVLGAGPVADAFFVALKLPNLFRRVTAEGAFSVSFVPIFASELEEKGREDAIRFAEEAQAVMMAVMVPFTILIVLAMPWVLYVVAPGFTDDGDMVRYDMALDMARITFPYIVLMSLVALLGGVMNSFDRFGPFAAAPILFNFSLIVALLFFAPLAESGGHAMAWGVMIAGVLQFAWLFYACRKLGVMLKWRKPKLTPRIRKLFRKMGPGVVGAGVAQINLFVDMVLASLLPVGAISYLYYADRLYQLPLSVIGIAIGTALLPMLSRTLKAGEGAKANRLFSRGIEAGLMFALPATVAYLVIGVTITDVLFVRKAFTASDGLQAGYALMAYSVGLPAFILSRVLSVVFFAEGDTATPVKYAIICAVLNTVLALSLIWTFKHVGIALATGLTAWVNLALLIRSAKKKGVVTLTEGAIRRGVTMLLSALVMGVGLFLVQFFIYPYFMDSSFAVKVCGLVLLMGIGGGIYGILLSITGILTLSMVKELFPKRKKQDTIEDVQHLGQ